MPDAPQVQPCLVTRARERIFQPSIHTLWGGNELLNRIRGIAVTVKWLSNPADWYRIPVTLYQRL